MAQSKSEMDGMNGHAGADIKKVGGARASKSKPAVQTIKNVVSPFTVEFDLELQLGVNVRDKLHRQYVNVYKGKEEYCFADEIPSSPLDSLDWATEVREWSVLDKKFPVGESLQKELSCTWCDNIAEPPVYMCKKGHLICGKDLHLVPTCPESPPSHAADEMCRAPFVNARCLFIEYLYFYSVIECRNQHKGCKVVLPGRELRMHQQKTCEFDFKIRPRRLIPKLEM